MAYGGGVGGAWGGGGSGGAVGKGCGSSGCGGGIGSDASGGGAWPVEGLALDCARKKSVTSWTGEAISCPAASDHVTRATAASKHHRLQWAAVPPFARAPSSRGMPP